MNRLLSILALASFVSLVPGVASADMHSMMGMKHHHKQCRDAHGKFMKCRHKM